MDYRIDHFAAAAYVHRKYLLPSGVSVSVGDIGGWGGDLLTFCGDWRRDSDSIASGQVYAEQRLAKITLPVEVDSTSMLVDLMMDADAYNISRRLLSGQSLVAAMNAYFAPNGPYLQRVSSFVSSRFCTAAGLESATRGMLYVSNDVQLVGARELLIIGQVGPTILSEFLPSSSMDPFVAGVKAALLAVQ